MHLQPFCATPSKISPKYLASFNDRFDSIYQEHRMTAKFKADFFSAMIHLFPKKSYPTFYSRITDYRDLFTEWNEIELVYFSINKRISNRRKIKNLIQRILQLLQKYPVSFNLWFYLGNCHAILAQSTQAISSYLEALKYPSNREDWIRLLHNLIIQYLETQRYAEATALIQQFDADVRNYPSIQEVIQIAEKLTGQQLGSGYQPI